jgi:hypothetical protein
MNTSGETWIIHELRLPWIRGTKDEAVVCHRESFVTKKIRRDRLAP